MDDKAVVWRTRGCRLRGECGAVAQAFVIGGVALASAALLAYGAVAPASVKRTGPAASPSERAEKRAVAAYGGLPLSFEENRGQTTSAVRFLARGSGYTLFLGPTEATLSLQSSAKPKRIDTVRMQLVGANENATISGRSVQPGKVNYLIGEDPSRWRTGIPTYGRVKYEAAYPGIDLVYYGKQGELEYDFVVAPGADADVISLRFDGVERASIDSRGDLVLLTPGGELRQRKPVLYQEVNGTRRPVSGHFVVRGEREVGFAVGSYDATKPLVIDPILGYSTYLGGTGVDAGFGIAVDGAGSAYAAGQTTSSNFPTAGAVGGCASAPLGSGISYPTTSLQCDQPGGDAFVTKLTPDGSGLVYSTYLGGSRTEQAWDVEIDAHGNAFVAGSTDSADNPGTPSVTESGFPVTVNAFDSSCGTDGYCNATIPADCLIGNVISPSGPGCQTLGIPDAFLAVLNAAGDGLLYSTYLGGAGPEQEINQTSLPSHMGVTVLGSRAYVASQTGSDDDPLTIGVDEGFPTTATAFQRSCGSALVPGCDNGNADAFLTVLETAPAIGASSLVYSSYLGGIGDDQAKAVAVDAAGNAYVAGTTAGLPVTGGDPMNDFPVKNALISEYAGGESDAFAAKFSLKAGNSGAQTLVYSTYLGGGGIDQAWGIAVDPGGFNKQGKPKGNGRAVFTGFTDSGDDPATPEADGPAPYFPTTPGAYDTTFNGRATTPDGSTTFLNGDAYVVRLTSTGQALEYSTFLGGSDHDLGGGVALDSAGNIYVTGFTTCENLTKETPDNPCVGTFPVTPDAPQGGIDGTFIGPFLHNSPTDVFVAKFNVTASTLLYGTYLGGNDFDRGFAVAVRDKDASGAPITPEAYVTGRVASTNYPTTEGALLTTKPKPLPTPTNPNPTGKGNRDAMVSKIVG